MTQKRKYQSQYPYFITSKSLFGRPLFENKKIAQLLIKNIFYYQQKYCFWVFASAVVPDKWFFLVQVGKGTKISKIMQLIKYRTASDVRKLLKAGSLAVGLNGSEEGVIQAVGFNESEEGGGLVFDLNGSEEGGSLAVGLNSSAGDGSLAVGLNSSAGDGSLAVGLSKVKKNHKYQRCKNSIWCPSYYCQIVDKRYSFVNSVNFIQGSWQKHAQMEIFSQEPYLYVNKSLIEQHLC